MRHNFTAVLVAAGSSSRMRSTTPKVLLPLQGRPILSWSIETLLACACVSELAIVCRKQDIPQIEAFVSQSPKPVHVVPGGSTRQDSVRRGVEALSPSDYLLIHDGARPLLEPEILEAVCSDAVEYGAATAAVACKDTCKLMDAAGFVEYTPPRERLMAVQTPQAFRRELYELAWEKAQAAGAQYTDDCQLMEAAGYRVKLTGSSYRNLKITTQEDLASARALLGGEEAHFNMRIGSGYDVHRLTEGRRLVLGGVEVPYRLGLLGHSDADVLAHAVSDALLGAAALGDIGKLFPDNDPKYEGADSLLLLEVVCGRVQAAGYQVGNIDATVVAQRPKLAPYIEQMRGNLARACGIDVGQVSVKATTEEGLGFTGRGDGIAAQAVCVIREAL